MAIGDLVLYNGRRYYLRGIDPMSVSNRRVQLEDAETGEVMHVPVVEIEPLENASEGEV